MMYKVVHRVFKYNETCPVYHKIKTVKRTAFKCQRDIYIIPTKWTDLFCDSKGKQVFDH